MIDAMGDAAVVIDFGMVTRMEVVPPGNVVPTRDRAPYGKFRCGTPFYDGLPSPDGMVDFGLVLDGKD